jgi:uncharacterized protein DUF6174
MSALRGLAVILAVVISACSSPLGPDEARELIVARHRWAERAFPDYTFETRHDCFCPVELIGPVRITVRQGTIESVTRLDTGDPAAAGDWYTIKELFDRIPTMAKEDGVDDMVIRYDATLGFPSSIELRFDEDILDAGSIYSITAAGPAS